MENTMQRYRNSRSINYPTAIFTCLFISVLFDLYFHELLIPDKRNDIDLSNRLCQ